MTEWFASVLDRDGQSVTVVRGAERLTVRAFVQPAAERTQTVPGAVTELGTADGRLWLYLGRTEVDAGDTVTWGGQTFTVRSSQPFYVGEALSHWWAALEKARSA